MTSIKRLQPARLARFALASLVIVVWLMPGTPPAVAAQLAQPVQRPVPSVAAPSVAPLTPESPSPFSLFLPVAFAPSAHIYWGALIDGNPPTDDMMKAGGAVDQFETQSGKKLSLLQWGQSWYDNNVPQTFQTAYFDNVRTHGSIPLLDWGSRDFAIDGPGSCKGTVFESAFQLSKITAGNYDTYIKQWAQAAKTWGHPFLLRLDWEMNGSWTYPWSEMCNGNQPGDFVKAWRHVHDLFAQVGATNASWVWCPNIASSTTVPGTVPYSELYPGDSYVDWTCIDGYNFYNDVWLTFNQIFTGNGIGWLDNSYQEALAVAPNKPILIGETASREAKPADGNVSKAAWLTDAYGTQIPGTLNHIKGVIYFNWDDNNPSSADLPIQSSAASIAAFKAAISSPAYAANGFAHLNTTNIQPLP